MKRKKHIKTAHLRAAALVVIAVIAGYLAVRFALAPGQEVQQLQERQTALLDSIRDGDGTITLPDRIAAMDVDFYDDGRSAPPEEAVFFMPAASTPEPDSIVEGETTEPVSEPVDPGIVNGIGILTYDRLDMKLPVAEGVSAVQLKIAVGHVPQTAAVGASGNAVIAGHRSYTFGEHFNRLGEAELGDIIQYQSINGESMVFVVDEILEVVPGDQTAFDQPEDKAQLTLYTCTPIRTATHRLLIRATRVI